MNLKLIESFVELIELGAFANKEDIAKGLKSAIKVTKESAELTDEEILNEWLLTSYNPKTYVWADDTDDDLVLHFAKAILRKAQEK